MIEASRLSQVLKEMTNYKLDLLGLSENLEWKWWTYNCDRLTVVIFRSLR